jgi:hypothetical protein
MFIQRVKQATLTMIVAVFMAMTSTVQADSHMQERHIDFSKETPSATLEFNVTAVKLLAGATWGEGVLHYMGKQYPFKVKAGTVGGIGYQKVEGVGQVYFLNKLEDFSGKYGGAGVGVTAGSGTGTATLENPRNVIIRAKLKAKGVALSASLGWIDIKFTE